MADGTAKNGGGLKQGEYLHVAMRFLGLRIREALLLPVGLVFNLVELKIRRLDGRKKGDRGRCPGRSGINARL